MQTGLSVAFRSIEFSEHVSEKPTSLWVEYSISDSSDLVRFQVKLPVRSSKSSTTIPAKFERSHKMPDWNAIKTPTLSVRMIAVGKSRGNSKTKSESVELWSASGTLKLSDLLHQKE